MVSAIAVLGILNDLFAYDQGDLSKLWFLALGIPLLLVIAFAAMATL